MTSCSESQRSTSASRPAHVSPSLESSTRYWSLRLLTWSISAALTLLPHGQGHAIPDRGEGGAQVVAPAELLVERAHVADVLLAPAPRGLLRSGRAREQHVVDEQEPARAQQRDDLVEVAGVAGLRPVDEPEVEAAEL